MPSFSRRADTANECHERSDMMVDFENCWSIDGVLLAVADMGPKTALCFQCASLIQDDKLLVSGVHSAF